jgi:hypothetical protein
VDTVTASRIVNMKAEQLYDDYLAEREKGTGQ